MPIVYPLTMPQFDPENAISILNHSDRARNFARTSFNLRYSQLKTTALDGRIHVTDTPGSAWYGSYELPSMNRRQASEWLTFLRSLNGSAGTFYAHDDSYTTEGKDERVYTLASILQSGQVQLVCPLNWTDFFSGELPLPYLFSAGTNRVREILQPSSADNVRCVVPVKLQLRMYFYAPRWLPGQFIDIRKLKTDNAFEVFKTYNIDDDILTELQA